MSVPSRHNVIINADSLTVLAQFEVKFETLTEEHITRVREAIRGAILLIAKEIGDLQVMRTCERCKGTGEIEDPPGLLKTAYACPDCRGTGTVCDD